MLSFHYFWRLFRYLNRNKVIILMFHGVMDSTISGNDWVPLRQQLSPRLLDSYLQVLSKYYSVISMDEAVDMLRGDIPLRPYSMVFTFDDGYRNNANCALPILEKYGIPATFFISTDHVEKQYPFWFDRFDYALQQLKETSWKTQYNGITFDFTGGSKQKLKKQYEKLRAQLKAGGLSDKEMLGFIDEEATKIEKLTGKSLQQIFSQDLWSGVLTWEEIEQLPKESVTIGSHTCKHKRLGHIDLEEVREELVNSKNEIEAHLDASCDHFCYPSGSYTSAAAQLVKKVGYKSAVTTEGRLNSVGDDPMLLGRFHVPYNGTVEDVLHRVCGLEGFLHKIKKFITSTQS